MWLQMDKAIAILLYVGTAGRRVKQWNLWSEPKNRINSLNGSNVWVVVSLYHLLIEEEGNQLQTVPGDVCDIVVKELAALQVLRSCQEILPCPYEILRWVPDLNGYMCTYVYGYVESLNRWSIRWFLFNCTSSYISFMEKIQQYKKNSL